MSKSEDVTLYAPDGRKYATSNRVEITRLKSAGYTETAPKKPEPAPVPDKK